MARLPSVQMLPQNEDKEPPSPPWFILRRRPCVACTVLVAAGLFFAGFSTSGEPQSYAFTPIIKKRFFSLVSRHLSDDRRGSRGLSADRVGMVTQPMARTQTHLPTANATCAERVAVCLIGGTRTFTRPHVSANVRSTIVSLSETVDVFAVVSPSDVEPKKQWNWGFRTLPTSSAEVVMQSLSTLGNGGGVNLRSVVLYNATQWAEQTINHDCKFPEKSWMSSEADAGRVAAQLRAWSTCMETVVATEKNEGFRYSRVVKLRPDAFWLRPPAPVCVREDQVLTNAFPFQDNFFDLPRKLAEPVMLGMYRTYTNCRIWHNHGGGLFKWLIETLTPLCVRIPSLSSSLAGCRIVEQQQPFTLVRNSRTEPSANQLCCMTCPKRTWRSCERGATDRCTTACLDAAYPPAAGTNVGTAPQGPGARASPHGDVGAARRGSSARGPPTLAASRCKTRGSCTHCAASVDESFADFKHAESNQSSFALHITAVASGCTRKLTGGDAWVVHFEGANGVMWRTLAQDHGNGEYTVPIPRAWRVVLPIVAHVQLWWTQTVPGSVLEQWNQRANAKPGLGRANTMFATLDRGSGGGDERVPLQCVGGALPPLQLPSSPWHLGKTSGTVGSSCDGGWWVKRGTSSTEWAPSWCSNDQTWGATDFDVAAARSCLGERQLLILGDSVTAGTYLDLCALLSNRVPACATAFSKSFEPLSPLPATEVRHKPPQNNLKHCCSHKCRPSQVSFAPVFGNFPLRHVGLANLVNSSHTSTWEQVFVSANATLVVLQSGLHDIGVPKVPPHDVVGPLGEWVRNLRSLGAFIERVQRANPRVRFIWRAMAHSLLMDDHSPAGVQASACNVKGYPQTYPPLVRRMNQLAADILQPFGVPIWDTPAAMSWNAPAAAFRDLNHHDVCGRQAALGTGTPCTAGRLGGKVLRNQGNWNLGGLSETITQTLFRVLGCKRPPPGATSGAVAPLSMTPSRLTPTQSHAAATRTFVRHKDAEHPRHSNGNSPANAQRLGDAGQTVSVAWSVSALNTALPPGSPQLAYYLCRTYGRETAGGLRAYVERSRFWSWADAQVVWTDRLAPGYAFDPLPPDCHTPKLCRVVPEGQLEKDEFHAGLDTKYAPPNTLWRIGTRWVAPEERISNKGGTRDAPTIHDGRWVEVVHTPYGGTSHGVLWMYSARGSGLWYDTGRTLVVSDTIDVLNFLNASRPTVAQGGRANMPFSEIIRTLHIARERLPKLGFKSVLCKQHQDPGA